MIAWIQGLDYAEVATKEYCQHTKLDQEVEGLGKSRVGKITTSTQLTQKTTTTKTDNLDNLVLPLYHSFLD